MCVYGESIQDGDNMISLSVNCLPVDQHLSFTIDIDDTLPRSALVKIRVTGSEIQGQPSHSILNMLKYWPPRLIKTVNRALRHPLVQKTLYKIKAKERLTLDQFWLIKK